MKKVIVTGANGFVGSAVCNVLVKEGYEVYAIIKSKESDISRLVESDNIHFIYCQMKDYDKLSEMISEGEYVCCYHFAWEGISGDKRSDENVQLNNIANTCKLIRQMPAINCHRFVFAASIMEYEIQKAVESNCKVGAGSIYSTSKLCADYMLKVIADSLSIEYIRGVISNIYGPGERSPRLINSTIRKLLRGEHCSFSPGEQLYDFIYIDDAARAFVKIGELGRHGKTYYIGNDKPRKLKEFLYKIRDIVAPDAVLGIGELQFNGVSLDYDEFDTDAIKTDTKFSPEISFEEGIMRTKDWIKMSDK